MKNLVAEYFEEKDGTLTITGEGGFLCYKIFTNQFYIAEFYIDREHRKSSKHFLSIMREAYAIAKAAGCDCFGAHVDVRNKNFHDVIKSRFKFGFRVVGIEETTKLAMILKLSECEWAEQSKP